jgi:hypothetical protein
MGMLLSTWNRLGCMIILSASLSVFAGTSNGVYLSGLGGEILIFFGTRPKTLIGRSLLVDLVDFCVDFFYGNFNVDASDLGESKYSCSVSIDSRYCSLVIAILISCELPFSDAELAR